MITCRDEGVVGDQRSTGSHVGLIRSDSSHRLRSNPDWNARNDGFVHIHRVHDIEMVLDARVGERETFVQDTAHRPFGFHQGLLGWDVGTLTPNLVRQLLILHNLWRVDEHTLLKMNETNRWNSPEMLGSSHRRTQNTSCSRPPSYGFFLRFVQHRSRSRRVTRRIA